MSHHSGKIKKNYVCCCYEKIPLSHFSRRLLENKVSHYEAHLDVTNSKFGRLKRKGPFILATKESGKWNMGGENWVVS